MLTSLKFLQKNGEWPPEGSKNRIARYARNRRIFKGNQKDDEKKFNRTFKFFATLASGGAKYQKYDYRTIMNFQKKISLKTADLLFQEVPLYLSTGDDEDEKTKAAIKERQGVVNSIVEDSKLNKIGYSGTIDASRYGDSVYLIVIRDSKAIATLSQPRFWFPVVSPDDKEEILFHVLAWEVSGGKTISGKEKKKLIVQVHSIGKYLKFTLDTTGGKIKSGIKLDAEGMPTGDNIEVVPTGLSDFAVVPIQNVVTSDTIFAVDDYSDINGIVDEIQTRYAQVAKILDKHAEPSMMGPRSALELDEESGEYRFKSGNFLPVEGEGDQKFSYVTWDGELESAFKHIDKLMNVLAIISEMGPAVFDTNYAARTNLSGKAFRFLFNDVLSKVSRIQKSFNEGFINVIHLCSEVGYPKKLDKKDISIKWQDGLPDDPEEQARTGQVRVNNKATDTIVNQIMIQDGVSLDEAIKKAEAIKLEEAASMPGIGLGIPFDPATKPTEPVGGDVITESPENIEATKGLNGAQANAAIGILNNLREGKITELGATELLITLGIAKERAEKMVKDQRKITITEAV